MWFYCMFDSCWDRLLISPKKLKFWPKNINYGLVGFICDPDLKIELRIIKESAQKKSENTLVC